MASRPIRALYVEDALNDRQGGMHVCLAKPCLAHNAWDAHWAIQDEGGKKCAVADQVQLPTPFGAAGLRGHQPGAASTSQMKRAGVAARR